MSLANNIKNLREQAGLTQAELAAAAGVSQVAIKYFENGERVPNAFKLILIAKKLHTTCEELVGDDAAV